MSWKEFHFPNNNWRKKRQEKKHKIFKIHLLMMSFGLQADRIARLARGISAANALEYVKSALYQHQHQHVD